MSQGSSRNPGSDVPSAQHQNGAVDRGASFDSVYRNLADFSRSNRHNNGQIEVASLGSTNALTGSASPEAVTARGIIPDYRISSGNEITFLSQNKFPPALSIVDEDRTGRDGTAFGAFGIQPGLLARDGRGNLISPAAGNGGVSEMAAARRADQSGGERTGDDQAFRTASLPDNRTVSESARTAHMDDTGAGQLAERRADHGGEQHHGRRGHRRHGHQGRHHHGRHHEGGGHNRRGRGHGGDQGHRRGRPGRGRGAPGPGEGFDQTPGPGPGNGFEQGPGRRHPGSPDHGPFGFDLYPGRDPRREQQDPRFAPHRRDGLDVGPQNRPQDRGRLPGNDQGRAYEPFMGRVSWYGSPQGTASGERYNPEALTAAHKTWPLGTRVKVTDPESGKSLILRVNDRGPYVRGRELDVSRRAARELNMMGAGVKTLQIQRLAPGEEGTQTV